MDETTKSEDEVLKSTRDVLKKWNDYYINNNFGIGIQCDKCNKWREVFEYQDSSEAPEDWICSMWKMDKYRRGSCRIPSDLKESDFAEALYSPGSLVWAKLPGHPWWPAMVEDSPDVQDYFMPYVDSEYEYHVTFFGSKPLRSWIKASRIKDFTTPPPTTPKERKNKDLPISIEQGNEALKMNTKERLKNYSFLVRYKGHWAKIKELDKIGLPPNCLKSRKKEKSSDFGSKLITKEPHANGDCNRTSTVRKTRNVKTKSKAATKRKSVDYEKSQSVQQSVGPKTECPAYSEKEENSEDENSEFRSQVMAEEPHANQDCHRASTVRKVSNVKSETVTKTKLGVNEESQPVLSVGAINECSADREKEQNCEKDDSAKFRSQVMAEEPHVNQDCPSTSTVRKVRNIKSKSKTGVKRKAVDNEEFERVKQSVGLKRNEWPVDPEKEKTNEEEDSSEFRSQVMAEELHVNQDCPSTSTVRKVRNIKSKSKTGAKRKAVDNEEFKRVKQSIGLKRNGWPVDPEKEKTSEEEDSSEFRSQFMTEEPHVNQYCHGTSTVRKVRNVKSDTVTMSKFGDNVKFQTVQQSFKHKKSECPTDSEKEENSEEEDSSVHKNTTFFSDNEEEDSPVLNDTTILSDSEEEEVSPELKAYVEYLNKKYSPLVIYADAKSLSRNDTGNNFSQGNSYLTIHNEHEDNFSENVSINNHENAAEYSQNVSDANILDTDPSLLRHQHPSCSSPKNENSNRGDKFKKNRELNRELVISNNSKYMPYSFYWGRMKK